MTHPSSLDGVVFIAEWITLAQTIVGSAFFQIPSIVVVVILAIKAIPRHFPKLTRQGQKRSVQIIAPKFEQAIQTSSTSVEQSVQTIDPPPPTPYRPPVSSSPPLFGPPNIISDGVYTYAITHTLGSGEFGRVVAATRTCLNTGARAEVAIKVFSKLTVRQEDMVRESIVCEATVLRLCAMRRASWLMRSLGMFQDEWNMYFVMELCAGTLADVIYFDQTGVEPWPVSTFRLWAAELVLAMEEMQSLGIFHRDLKPANVLIDARGHLVIADFGISDAIKLAPGASLYQSGSDWCVGSQQYQAPEVWDASPENPYNCAVDLWQLGLILIEMFMGKPYFTFEGDIAKIEAEVKHKDFGPDIAAFVPEDAQALVSSLLSRDPKKRPTLQEVKQSPFFRGTNWKKVSLRKKNGIMPMPKEPASAEEAQNALKFPDTFNAELAQIWDMRPAKELLLRRYN
ncbi:kinase-like protein [Auriscalpium vulgare]|uniref:Kinase-like protein n=1 Tax=Auriscalpium vulgare TaxID=40419 RepID=A0ACB8RRP9_9AGAM|nr:kinase-like protein [Auriscalpium vulgare]